MAFEYRRKPAIRRRISEIKDDDVRVRIMGIILEKTEDMMAIDDGSGKADILLDKDDQGDLEIKTMVEAICRVMPTDEGRELKVEAITDMSNIDMDLFNKVFAR